MPTIAQKGQFHRIQSLGEEIANAVTHGIGAGLSIAGLTLLVVYASLTGEAARIVSVSIYGATLIALFLSSTLYHSFSHPKIKRMFRLMDHISIYLLIAGTYTPITLVTMRGTWGWVLFGLIWAMALFGIWFKSSGIDKHERLSVGFYIAMGWLVIIAIKPMLVSMPFSMLVWIVVGGLCYTLGIVFYVFKRMPYHHSVWHLFVLGGAVAHFFGILFHVSIL